MPIRCLAPLLLALLGACATPVGEAPPPDHGALAASRWAQLNRMVGADMAWRHQRYGSRKPTTYRATEWQGRPAIHAHSEAGNSTLRLPLRGDGPPPRRLAFSWFLPALNPAADLRDADADDAVVRVILSFDGDRSGWTARDHVLSELVQLITGEPMPDATLMYVWDHRYPVGTMISNPHTERIRMLVVQSGPQALGTWVAHERDIEADHRQVFGGAAPRLSGVGLMTDSNNTGATVSAWYGPLQLLPGADVHGQR